MVTYKDKKREGESVEPCLSRFSCTVCKHSWEDNAPQFSHLRKDEKVMAKPIYRCPSCYRRRCIKVGRVYGRA